MKILITGAHGGLGKIILKKLKSQGRNDLVVLSRNNTNIFKDIETRIANLDDQASLDAAMRGIDAIIHLAAVTRTNDKKEYFKTNTEGTKHLLLAAEKNNVKRFIFVSSRSASRAGGAYANSKLLAEEAVKKYRSDWIILQPAEIYGAKDSEMIQKLIKKIQSANIIPVPGNGKYALAPVFADDVADAIIAALDTLHVKTNFVLAGPESFKYLELCELIANALHKKIIKIFIPLCLLRIIARLFPKTLASDQIPRLLVPKPNDSGPARKYLGFQPQSLKEYSKLIARENQNG